MLCNQSFLEIKVHQRSNCLQRGDFTLCESGNCYVNVSIDYFFPEIWIYGGSFWYEPELCISSSFWGSVMGQSKISLLSEWSQEWLSKLWCSFIAAQVNLRHTAAESGIFSIPLPEMYFCFCFDAGTHALVSLLRFFDKSMWLCIHEYQMTTSIS